MNFKKLLLPIFITNLFYANTVFSATIENQNAANNNNKLPLKEISKIAEVFSKISDRYVDNVDKSELMLNGLKGMVKSLDPYSRYLTADEYNSFMTDISGENTGIGTILSSTDNGLKIETVLKGSPAEKAGLESGDVIIKVGNKYIIDNYKTPFDALNDIKGKIDSIANITVQKGTDKSIKEFKIKRDSFVIPSTTVKLIDDNYGYMFVSSFQENTQEEIEKELLSFKVKNPNAKGYILDLRSNPGGLLSSAVSISDMFLDDGKIVSTKGKYDHSSDDAFASYGDLLEKKPLIVLIDSGTASAAEIVAGALQDNKRAIVAGQTSYGKGSVQSIFKLNGNDGDAVKLTIARYYTPSGRSIQAEGIVPDIKISRVSSVDVVNDYESREADNVNHISNDTNYKAIKSDEKKDIDHLYSSISDDYALYEAMNILKAISLNDENKKD